MNTLEEDHVSRNVASVLNNHIVGTTTVCRSFFFLSPLTIIINMNYIVITVINDKVQFDNCKVNLREQILSRRLLDA